MRILFAGNSITYLPPEENNEFGWTGGYGMAASCPQNDYVHLTVRELERRFGNIEYMARNIAVFEFNYGDDFDYSQFAEMRKFKADVIVMRIIENVNHSEIESKNFGSCYCHLIDYLNADGGALIITSGNFWHDPAGDSIIRALSEKCGYTYVSFDCLRDEHFADLQAHGLFRGHEGIEGHPGDRGMEKIAGLITQAVISAVK